MLTAAINLPLTFNLSAIEAMIESCCEAEGLRVTLKGTLVSYVGCVHWHLKKGSQRGTLEITFWPKTHQFWFKVNAGRMGIWTENSITRLTACLSK